MFMGTFPPSLECREHQGVPGLLEAGWSGASVFLLLLWTQLLSPWEVDLLDRRVGKLMSLHKTVRSLIPTLPKPI